MSGVADLPAFFGDVAEASALTDSRALAVARLVADGNTPGFRLVEARRKDDRAETLVMQVHVPRPQDVVHALKAVEPVALRFHENDAPAVFSLRENFPPVPHSTAVAPEIPTYLCIDDRPWSEARPSWTPSECLVRVQSFLAKTALGELHGRDRAPYPLFASARTVIVLPRAILDGLGERAVELSVCRMDGGTGREILVVVDGSVPDAQPRLGMTVLGLKVPPQDQGQIRYPPRTLRQLAEVLRPLATDLLGEIRARALASVSAENPDERARGAARLKAHVAVLVAVPMREEGSTTTAGTDLRAFLTRSTLLDVARRFGWLDVDPKGGVGLLLFQETDPEADDELVPAEPHLDFDRELATLLSGREEIDDRKVTLVGAGAVGSHVAADLAREGLFTWTVIDPDQYLPHNAARHVLYPQDRGVAKAPATAAVLDAILGGGSGHVVADVLAPLEDKADEVRTALRDCDLILDASASVAVGRHLASPGLSDARRMSFFFNPVGTDAVLIAEPEGRAVTLRDLEAQYYAELLTNEDLDGHLTASVDRVSYSGACRQATNRMPEGRVAALSGLVATEVGAAARSSEGYVRVWRTGGRFLSVRIPAVGWSRHDLGTWTVNLSDGLAGQLANLRSDCLAAETGGVLLGVIDTERRSVHLCAAIGAPPDSVGDTTSFERGVAGLREAVRAAARSTGGQLAYAGEWHSHPPGAPACPSPTDLVQLRDLAAIQDANGVPGLMIIAGEDGVSVHSGELVERIGPTQAGSKARG